MRGSPPDRSAFIAANLRLAAPAGLPELVLHIAHPGSGLSRLVGSGAPPYWAFPWPGGAALARHVLDRPATVAGKRVLDLGAGCGLVGIAAAKAGAAEVLAAETDRDALAALALNASANGVAITALDGDILGEIPPAVDIVLVGDLFYAADLAQRVTAFLDRCREAGIAVLVGDIGRAHLPLARLTLVAEYAVAEVGAAKGAMNEAGIFAFAFAHPRVAASEAATISAAPAKVVQAGISAKNR